MFKTNLMLIFWIISASLYGQEITRLNDTNYKLTSLGKASAQQLKNTRLLRQSEVELTNLKCREDKQGNSHCRYQLTLQNIPVKGLQITTHYSTRTQETTSIIPRGLPGEYNLALSTRKISYPEALDIAKENIAGENYKKLEASPTGTDEGLVIVPQNYDFKKPVWVLAYEIDVQTEEPWQSKRITIDAQSGAVIFTEERLCSFVPGTAETYHHGTKPVETTLQNGVYIMEDQTRGTGIFTYDAYGGIFTDNDNYWDTDLVAGDAHWGSAATFDFYLNELGHNGIDGNGMGIQSTVHLQMANAYWDGTGTFYGDGDAFGEYDLPFTYINIISHEVSHGVTQFSSGLIYSGESGALNESFSDIMGMAVEHYTNPGAVDWLLGDETSSAGSYFRNMANPNDVSMSDTYLGQYWDAVYQEVHTNSSIGNFWFYLLVSGGSGVNDNNYSYTVDSLGWEKSWEIAYTTWVNYLGPSSDYLACAESSILATELLYGSCSFEVEQVRNAWAAVGVLSSGSEAAIQASSQVVCEIPTPIDFFATGSVTNHLWDFGDGNQSTQAAPSHTYQDVGTYTVSLSGVDCNNDSVSVVEQDFIVVDTLSSDCDTIFMDINQTVTSCGGVLVDDGGVDGYYANNVYTTVEIETPNAQGYDIDIQYFNTESGFDYLSLYIDNGNGYEFYQNFNGNLQPSAFTVAATKIQFIWDTDYSVTDPGFIIAWQCLTPGVPEADFSSQNTTSCDGYIALEDESLGFPDSWSWLLDGTEVSTDENPLIALPAIGTYDIGLIACNSFGCDTLTVPDYVTYDDQLSFCDTIPMTDDLIMTSYACEGVLVDDGGIDGDYANSVYSIVEVAAPGALAYNIDLLDFTAGTCCDELYIYIDVGGNYVFYQYFEGTTTTPVSFTVETTRIQFIWQTSGVNTNEGFVLNWQCLTPSIPTADFSSQNTTSCDGYIALEDESLGFPDSWSWLLDGTEVSTDQNPLITLPAVGTYDIGLIACNSLGCDTLTVPDYVTYDDQLSFCDTIIMVDNLDMTSYACEGVLVDDGGISGNYANNVYSTVEVEAPGALAYAVNLQSFFGEGCCDYLRIYANNGSGYQLAESFYGSPPLNTYIIEGSKIRFLWDTDGSVVYPGFVVSWQCIGADTAPLSAPDYETQACSYAVTLNSNSFNADSVVWDLGDGNTATGMSVTHNYQQSGTYTVYLEATNAYGTTYDSLIVETAFEVAMFTAPTQMLLNTSETISLSSHTQSEVWNTTWYLDGVFVSNSYYLSLELTELGMHTLTCVITDFNNCTSTHSQDIEGVEVVAIEDPSAWNGITVFPNPTNGTLNIGNLPDFNTAYEVSLLNAVGQLVRTAVPTSGSDQLSMNIQAVPAGVYFIKIQAENKAPFFKKVVKVD